MMINFSNEQSDIINAPLEPISVIACAGSGKTWTAVHRLIEMRRRIGEQRGRIALLSFSNVAVSTFSKIYNELAQGISGFGRSRVEIDTLDGFISKNILNPHAVRTMQCKKLPFLIAGTEPFLKNQAFHFWIETKEGRKYPIQPNALHNVIVNFQDGIPSFLYRQHNSLLVINNAEKVVRNLGEKGAYTHELGRYWCYRTLKEQPAILSALVCRYPYIIIDEAQDIGTSHQAILELLIEAGVQLTLIGDPNQGIYEFAGADGSFLSQYGRKSGVKTYPLTCNYRSILPILNVANKLSSRTDEAYRKVPVTFQGAYFISYKADEKEQLISAFCAELQKVKLSMNKSAVLCRSRTHVDELAGRNIEAGQGIVKIFVEATILRDRAYDYNKAFNKVIRCLISLLNNPPENFMAMISKSNGDSEMSELRRVIWEFVRNPNDGLPSAELVANKCWHSKLKNNVEKLLQTLECNFGLIPEKNLGVKLANKSLPNTPLIPESDLVNNLRSVIRIDTVHQAKGESLDAVLYLATEKSHIQNLLNGTDTEIGRIGYVAITRAKELLWLGVPENCIAKFRGELINKGFIEIGRN